MKRKIIIKKENIRNINIDLAILPSYDISRSFD